MLLGRGGRQATIAMMVLMLWAAACSNQTGSNSNTGTGGAGPNAVPSLGTGGSAGSTGGTNASNAVASAASATRPPAPVPGASPTSVASQTVSVSMTDANQFSPSTIDVPRGQTVVWTNTGRNPHTVTDDASKASNKSDAVLPQGAQAWDSATVGPGATFSRVFDTPGQYTYFCSLHEGAGMVARINVSG